MRRALAFLFVGVLLAGAALAAPQPPMPTDAPLPADGVHASAEAAAPVKKSGPPQFDATTFPSQLFWLALTLGTLYALMAGAALPRIAQGIEARAAHIGGLLDDARRIRDEAEQHKDDLAASSDAAYQRAHEILNKAASESQDIANRRNHELEAILDLKQKASEERIGAARANALQSIREASCLLLPAVFAKLADLRLADSEITALVNNAESEWRGAA